MSYWDNLAGTSFRRKHIEAMSGEEELTLVAEPENEYDQYAVKVLADGKHIGYIKKGRNETISKLLLDGSSVVIDDYNITGGGAGDGGEEINYGINVHIRMPNADSLDKLEKIVPDIGDGFVYFDPVAHKYYDEEGQPMISGSMAEESEVGVVDMSYASKAMAKSTGMKESVILGLWDKNGELSREFGTLIHESFDFYIKNKERLRHYDSIKERKHSASNWMPNTIGNIIDDYMLTHDLENAQSEVFVRFGKYCGRIDQLVYNHDGSLTINDYKIINKLKTVKTKSHGMVHKYTVQQSFYRDILVANGEKVAAMNINAFDGETWQDIKLTPVVTDVQKEQRL